MFTKMCSSGAELGVSGSNKSQIFKMNSVKLLSSIFCIKGIHNYGDKGMQEPWCTQKAGEVQPTPGDDSPLLRSAWRSCIRFFFLINITKVVTAWSYFCKQIPVSAFPEELLLLLFCHSELQFGKLKMYCSKKVNQLSHAPGNTIPLLNPAVAKEFC